MYHICICSCISGLFVGVYINTTNSTIIEGVNFTFMCGTPPELQQYDTTFTVLIDDLPAGSRVVSLEEAINGSQSFNFTSTSYLDDGLVFTCVANGTIKSTNLSISVLCKLISLNEKGDMCYYYFLSLQMLQNISM